MGSLQLIVLINVDAFNCDHTIHALLNVKCIERADIDFELDVNIITALFVLVIICL